MSKDKNKHNKTSSFLNISDFEEAFRDFFTKDELIKIIIPKIAAKGNCAFVINTQNFMFEVNCYYKEIVIIDLYNDKKITKDEFLQKIKDDEFKPMQYLSIDL